MRVAASQTLCRRYHDRGCARASTASNHGVGSLLEVGFVHHLPPYPRAPRPDAISRLALKPQVLTTFCDGLPCTPAVPVPAASECALASKAPVLTGDPYYCEKLPSWAQTRKGLCLHGVSTNCLADLGQTAFCEGLQCAMAVPLPAADKCFLASKASMRTIGPLRLENLPNLALTRILKGLFCPCLHGVALSTGRRSASASQHVTCRIFSCPAAGLPSQEKTVRAHSLTKCISSTRLEGRFSSPCPRLFSPTESVTFLTTRYDPSQPWYDVTDVLAPGGRWLRSGRARTTTRMRPFTRSDAIETDHVHYQSLSCVVKNTKLIDKRL